MKTETKALLRKVSPWFVAGIAIHALCALVVLLFFTTEWPLIAATSVAEAIHPEIAGPDNWAMGLTYLWRLLWLGVMTGCAAEFLGIYRMLPFPSSDEAARFFVIIASALTCAPVAIFAADMAAGNEFRPEAGAIVFFAIPIVGIILLFRITLVLTVQRSPTRGFAYRGVLITFIVLILSGILLCLVMPKRSALYYMPMAQPKVDVL